MDGSGQAKEVALCSYRTTDLGFILDDEEKQYSCFIDEFVLTFMMVGFFSEIYVGSQIEVLVTAYPELGFYTSPFATMIPLVIYFLRKTQKPVLYKDKAIVLYRFYEIGTSIPAGQGDISDSAGYVIQLFYHTFGLIMVMGFSVLMAIVWITPASYRFQQRKHYVALEFLYTCEDVDVFYLAVFTANLDISQFAAFIVGDSCDGINKTLEQDKFDMLLGGDDKCFNLVANLKSSAWLIFTSAFMLVGISYFYLCVFHSCLDVMWNVYFLLGYIANADPRFHTLIETDALITGYSYDEMSRFLYGKGLK